MKSRQWLVYLLLGLASAAYLYPFMRVAAIFGDEGTLLCGAQRVAEGAVPGRDFFEAMGPASFYWLGFFFRLFGTTWLVARAVLLITGVAVVLMVYWLGRRLDVRCGSFASIFLLLITLPLWPATSHHLNSELLALVSFAAFLKWLDTSRPSCIYLAGVLAGVTTTCMQETGVLLLLAYVCIWWVLDRQTGWAAPLRLLAGYAGVLATTAGYFYIRGALADLVYANVIWPLTNYGSINHVPYGFGLGSVYFTWWLKFLSQLLPRPAAYGMATMLILPLLAIAGLPAILTGAAVFRRKQALNRATAPYWIAGCALWVAEMHRMDIAHLVFGSPLLLVLCLHLLATLDSGWWQACKLALGSSLALLAIFNLLGPATATAKMVTRRGIVYAAASDGALEFLEQHTRPGERAFVYPYSPMYYFLSGTENATRYSILVYRINTDAQFREVVAALEKDQVRYVLWDAEGSDLRRLFPSYDPPPAESLILEPYLTAHYRMVGVQNGVRLLERRGSEEAQAHMAVLQKK